MWHIEGPISTIDENPNLSQQFVESPHLLEEFCDHLSDPTQSSGRPRIPSRISSSLLDFFSSNP
jgi:hypothetical protein